MARAARPASAPAAREAPQTALEARLALEGKRPRKRKADKNPLREGLRLERVPDPSVFVLFGATGDLARRKVMPALYQLWRTNLMPHEFRIVAIGRRDYDDEGFRAEIRAALESFSRVAVDDADAQAFVARIDYHRASACSCP